MVERFKNELGGEEWRWLTFARIDWRIERRRKWKRTHADDLKVKIEETNVEEFLGAEEKNWERKIIEVINNKSDKPLWWGRIKENEEGFEIGVNVFCVCLCAWWGPPCSSSSSSPLLKETPKVKKKGTNKNKGKSFFFMMEQREENEEEEESFIVFVWLELVNWFYLIN